MTAGSLTVFKGDLMIRHPKIAAGATTGLAVVLLMQFIPYGRTHSNPPTTGHPAWDSPRTEQLARRACYDCHSNETKWPWYASIAPVSWGIKHDVDEARSKLNFSNFDQPQDDANEAAECVQKGEMPPWSYGLMHPQSRLSESEKRFLVQGLQATFGGETGAEDADHDDDD